MGRRVHYYFNYSAGEVRANYAYGPGTNLLDRKPVSKSDALTLGPWDLAIVEEEIEDARAQKRRRFALKSP
jgi:beta-galactosidase